MIPPINSSWEFVIIKWIFTQTPLSAKLWDQALMSIVAGKSQEMGIWIVFYPTKKVFSKIKTKQ